MKFIWCNLFRFREQKDSTDKVEMLCFGKFGRVFARIKWLGWCIMGCVGALIT